MPRRVHMPHITLYYITKMATRAAHGTWHTNTLWGEMNLYMVERWGVGTIRSV